MDLFEDREVKKKKKSTSYKLMNIKDRIAIRELLDNGFNAHRIGLALRRHSSTISLEIEKNGGVENYDPYEAQNSHDEKKRKKASIVSELNKKIWGEKKEDREPLKEDTPEPEVCEGEMVAKKPSKALLTLEDRKIIREMLYQEVSYSQIGFRLGRHYSSISAEVKKNGGVYKYDPVKAQELAESERNKKIQFINEKRSFREIEINKMKDRIYCLEMQLEILINQVRKITDDKKD